MAATQPVKTVYSLLVFCLQLTDNLTMEELELRKEFVSFGTPGRYFAINELAFFLETMSWCAPFLADSGTDCLGDRTYSPNIVKGQANPHISITIQALSTDVKTRARKEMFETGSAPDCLNRTLRRLMVMVMKTQRLDLWELLQ